jgi:hypothetical protein
MLKDRRALLEHDLAIARNEAARLYLDIVTHGGDVHSEAYQSLRDKVGKLQFDLDLVNQLIDKGQP